MKWWDEEFWATVAITFASVAVTIGLTVWISWGILQRQLKHERDSQDQQRKEQLADLRAEIDRDRRIRQAAGLAEGLANLAHVVHSHRRFRFTGMVENAGHVLRAIDNLDPIRARLIGTNLDEYLEVLLDATSLWVNVFKGDGDIRRVPADLQALWDRAGSSIHFKLVGVQEAVHAWEESGEIAGASDEDLNRLSEALADMRRSR